MGVLRLFGTTVRLALACVVLMAGSGGALAQAARSASDLEAKSVLELYTSQGCSSCPAADKLLKSFINRPDVIALSLSVDYWDYLGWKDTLADPTFTRRQKLYSKMRGDGRIYTPQIVVNGLAHVNGAHVDDIAKAIAMTSGKLAGEHVPVRLAVGDGKISIDAGAVAEGDKPRDATIWLVSVQKEVEVPVRGGENSGRTLTYHNVVRELKSVGTWHGKPVTLRLDRAAVLKSGADACAVLLQVGQTGPILGADFASRC